MITTPAEADGKTRLGITCSDCSLVGSREPFQICAGCTGNVIFRYAADRAAFPAHVSTMWDFLPFLPLRRPDNIVSLGEGATPLIGSARPRGCRLLWKNEGRNPTGSQKDRAISVAISVAKEHGYRRVIVASTGSVGLSCAAYCSRAGIPCLVLVPRDTPVERLKPMIALGARVVVIDGTFAEIEGLLASLDPADWYQASTIRTVNCYQSEGPKTIAYETVLQLGQVPDWMVVPIGGGGTLQGIWRGFVDLKELGLTAALPRIVGVHVRQFNALERAMQRGLGPGADLSVVALDETVETVCRNLKHGLPPDAAGALRALIDSAGLVISVEDEEALESQRYLGVEEGIFCEPSSAVVHCATRRLVDRGVITGDQCVVAVVTGSGFRELGALGDLRPVLGPVPVNGLDLDAALGSA